MKLLVFSGMFHEKQHETVLSQKETSNGIEQGAGVEQRANIPSGLSNISGDTPKQDTALLTRMLPNSFPSLLSLTCISFGRN